MQGEEILFQVGIGLSKGALRATSSRVVLVTRLAALTLAGILVLPFTAARAQDATWLANPADANLNNGANWSTGTVPTGTAFFGASNVTRLELNSVNLQTSIDGWTLNAGASNYILDNLGTSQLLFFTGAGVVINGGSLSLQTSNGGGIEFQNGSSASSASFINVVSQVNFSGTSTAADASIFNQNTYLRFLDNASAGNAAIAATDRTAIQFSGNSTADHATITLTGPTLFAGITSVNFADNSTAGNSTITGDSRSEINFSGNATAGNSTITNNNKLTFGGNSEAGTATITNNSQLTFNDSSTAGGASIVNNDRIMFNGHSLAGGSQIANSGYVGFTGNSNGAGAQITNSANGVVDLSGSTGFSGDGKLTIGSFIGGGNFYLGSNQITISNGNGTVSGVISDCGAGGTACANSGASGGALVKTGSGTMILANANTYTGGTTISSGILQLGDATHAGSIMGDVRITSGAGYFHVVNADTAGITSVNNSGFTYFQNSTNAATAAITNNFRLAFQDASSAGNAAIANNALLYFRDAGTAGNAAITNNVGGTVDFSASSGPNGDHKLSAGSIAGAGNFYLGSNALAVGGNNQNTTVGGTISDCGAGGAACIASGATGGMLVKAGAGDLTLSGANTYTGGTRVVAGTLSLANNDALGTAAVMLDPNTTLHLAGVQIANTVNVSGDPNIAVTGANSLNSIVGPGDVNVLGTSGSAAADVLTLNGPNAYTANTFVGNGTAGAAATLKSGGVNALSANSTTTVTANSILDLNGFDQAIGALAGAGTVTNGGASAVTLTANGNNSSTIFSGVIEDGSATTALTKIGTGTLALTGTSSYTGATNINAGTLEVDGSIASSASVTVNAGATLSGIGIVDPATTTIMPGGTLAPGNAANPAGILTITGNLAFQSAAVYRVNIGSSTAAFANVTGSATLGGATVNAVFSNTSYVNKLYSILTANGGVSGTFASGVVNTNLPAGFQTSLSYDATHAYLNVSLDMMPGSSPTNPGGGMSGNQQAVANVMMNSFNANGGIPMVYGMLNAAGLTQVSGELATASQQSTFDAMSQFMGLLTDPFMQRSGGVALQSGSSAYVEDSVSNRARTDAFAMFTKAPPRTFAPRWSVWSAGFGGSQSTNGNAVVGSNDTTSRLYGAAVGADYLFAPRTLAGFALAGGGTGFSVNGLGSGRSDLFQAGAYLRHADGPAHVSAALAYGWQDITTDRYVTVAGGDHLRAEFNANAYSGRVEGGYRFVAPAMGGVGLTPYAASQFITFALPAYAERALSGANAFALAYGSKSVTDARSELGVRSDKSFAMADGVLALRGRLAWAHDYNPDRAIAATFQALPGAGFTVNGAAQASDSVLTTASAEVRWLNGWSAAITFEGAFSDVTRSYAGKAAVRCQW